MCLYNVEGCMKNAAQTRILAIALALATLAACVLAAMNFQRENGFDVPTDGIWWVEAPRRPAGRARSAQLPRPARRRPRRRHPRRHQRPADPASRPSSARCSAAASGPTPPTPSFVRAAHSTDLKNAAKFDVQVILEPKDRSINQGLRFIALVYLCIGIYVLFRRWTAPKSTHFYVFCLVSFVLYSFRYTSELDTFDWIIYWGNIAAQLCSPRSSCTSLSASPMTPARSDGRGSVRRLLIIAALPTRNLPHRPAGLPQSALVRDRSPPPPPRPDRVGYLALYYVIAAIVFLFRYRRAESALERQQLKWLTRGTLLASRPSPSSTSSPTSPTSPSRT